MSNPNPTRISDPIWGLWTDFLAYNPDAKLGGIYADKAGYHNYRNNLPSNDYSVEEVANDRLGPGDKASAIDITLSAGDMVKFSTRLANACKSRDPRLFIGGEPVIREFIGTLDNKNVYCYMLTGGKAQGVPTDAGVDWGRDTSHLWHVHISFIRKFINSELAMSGILSILKGEAYEDWEGNMPTANEIAKAVWDYRISQDAKFYAPASAWLSYGNSKVDKANAALAAIAEKVDVSPEEIQAIKDAIVVPTADENAQAFVAALGANSTADIAEALKAVLGEEKAAALKEAL